MRKATEASPLDELLPYERAWVDDDARYKIGLWSRQIGKSFTTAAEAVRDCTAHKTKWVILSRGERQALEWMEKARTWTQAFSVAVAGYTEERNSPEALLTQAEIEFSNGSRIIAIPANPETARGYSCNVILDEFARHEKPDEIWRAMFPSITNPFGGIKKVRVVSTPNGLGNRFSDIWHKSPNWSKHKVTIHDAIAQGLKLDADELRAGLDDPEGWAQEYECEFIDAAAVLLGYELIAPCESDEATRTMGPDYWLTPKSRFMGIDFGRKKDLTVAWTLEKIGDIGHTSDVLEMRNTSTPDQISQLRHRIMGCTRVCVDYTGPGVGFGDSLVAEFGEYRPEGHLFGKVELCTFTNPMKVDLFSKLRMLFERRGVRVPVDRTIREDLHSVQRVTTTSGTVTYKAPHSADGHADRCTALALANRALATGGAGALSAENLDRIRIGGSAPNRPMFQPSRFR